MKILQRLSNKIKKIWITTIDPLGHRALLKDVTTQLEFWHKEQRRTWQLVETAHKHNDRQAMNKYYQQNQTAKLRAEQEMKRIRHLLPKTTRDRVFWQKLTKPD